jgi:hypothetical protein
MAPLDRLTPAQEAGLADVRDQWQAVGLATSAADRPAAERGVRRAYVAVGLPPPSAYIWVRSPLEAVVGGAHLAVPASGRLATALEESYLELSDRSESALRGQVWSTIGTAADDRRRRLLARSLGFDPRWITSPIDGAWDAARRQLRPLITAALAAQVRIDVGVPVRRRVVERVLIPIAQQIRADVWPHLRQHLEARLSEPGAWLRRWAVLMAGYRLLRVHESDVAPLQRRTTIDRLAMADAFVRVCGLNAGDWLEGLMEVAHAAGGWWPHRSGVLLCERPASLALDDQGRLHNGLGPAAHYRDGWQVWAWHGVRVPRRAIEEPQVMTADEIMAEPDVAVRRVMIERVGNERFMREVGPERLAEDPAGILWRVDLMDDEPVVCVEVTNASAGPDGIYRRHMLRVPPTVRSPREAVAWTFGFSAADYQPTDES